MARYRISLIVNCAFEKFASCNDNPLSGYEIEGIHRIPDNTPALFVIYHGAIPIDLYYLLARVYLLKNRLIHTVADRFLFKIPGMLELYFVKIADQKILII